MIPDDGSVRASFRVVRFPFAISAVSDDVDILAEKQRILPQNQIQFRSGEPTGVVIGAFTPDHQRLLFPQLGEELFGFDWGNEPLEGSHAFFLGVGARWEFTPAGNRSQRRRRSIGIIGGWWRRRWWFL